ncbi:hypothetical protein LSCM1_05133 [Leishmania martiniquensis]|uniref:Protein kinase domain-containing protein n=1 Tax=Leishmania martiniquensis TaxID=1580590 RepID=A0A836KKN4_9TRYP|nr:hypothetical protein LSCM1_05133 [Leishmania martiniquensis]
MGCHVSTQASPKERVGSSICIGDEAVSIDRNSGEGLTNRACILNSKNLIRTRSSVSMEEQEHGRGIDVVVCPNPLMEDGVSSRGNEGVVGFSSADKSTHTGFTFPPLSLASTGRNAEVSGSREKKLTPAASSPLSAASMQRQLSNSNRGRQGSFTKISHMVHGSRQAWPPLTHTPTPQQIAAAPFTRVSTPSPKRLSHPKSAYAGASTSVSITPVSPSHEEFEAQIPDVNDGSFTMDPYEEGETPRHRGIPLFMTAAPGHGNVGRGTMAPSGSLGGGVYGGGQLTVSPKWITLPYKRSQSTVSLLSLADTPNNHHALYSGSDFGRDVLGGSPVFTGLTTGGGSSPPQSGYGMGRPMPVERLDQQRHHNGLATFGSQPRECALCRNATVSFACEVCDDFYLCENCRFDAEAVRAMHHPTHAMLSMQDNHCCSSRTFGGDSIFSLSGDGGASSLFYRPCVRCKRSIDDAETVYRCDQCDYILCQECFLQQLGPEDAMERASSLSTALAAAVEENGSGRTLPVESTALALASAPAPPHEHELKRFRRKSRSNSVHEGALVTKTRNSGGNKVINDYVVVSHLGHGSYAKVKLVQHIHTQELFALKILRRQKKAVLSGISLGRSRVRAGVAGTNEDDLLREIAVMKFIDHPNVVKLKEVIEDVDSQKVYIIMEYCERGPVHVPGDPALPLEQVRQYGADILRGLLHLHSEFLYHRDIKPANCLVNGDGVVKIADFGTCNSQIRTKLSEGTPAFSCPEQVRGEEVSGEVVDSWAFALTLCEMACGTLPVSTTSFMQHRSLLLSRDPVPIPETSDVHLHDLLARLLEKDLSQRMLLPEATRHPFFAELHVDMHGAVPDATLRPTSAVSAASGGSAAAQQRQLLSLAELYDRALESVHRGKNLKDCFHGVRAMHRVRRKEVETARHNAADAQVSDGAAAVEVSPYFVHSGSAFGGNDRSGSDGEDEDGAACLWVGGRAGQEEEAVAAVEEIVEHQLFSQEPKLDLAYVTLATPSTLEKLNELHQITAEMRLSHNALVHLEPLRFCTFSLLMEIVVTFNRLETFPQAVLSAPRLVRLDLSHNRIGSIPGSLVTQAPFLERLSLHHNLITSVGIVSTTVAEPSLATPRTSTPAAAASPGPTIVGAADTAAVSPPASPLDGGGSSHNEVVSVLAAPCLRHVRLSGNPLEHLPEALETTHKLQLVLDAIPALMEEWEAHLQSGSKRAAAGAQSRPSAVIVWDDSFPVRIPNVEPAVWLEANNVAIYRVQTLRVCKTRRVVLCQCADPRFPNGLFRSEELEAYFTALTKALQERREQRHQLVGEALPPIVGKAARSYVESYFFVTDDEDEEEGGYHSLVSYLYDSLCARIPVLVVVASSGTSSAVRTNIVAAISTSLTRLRGGDPDQLDAEQAELIVSTMRSLYA